ncbi:Hpt domain-containing protein [Uliginosibacterium aquaticum]|uniref:Hpt domain-containing protein n=1 Tax=Uliginosibacterium aquaticum TaxID=2731212 RepID=A0ABX2IDF3_9RHOO|nr:Hpt domain-containing protein [Uliginosibacterium aquaticum]NSL54082.1 Hpt domain-containing protein [Uliginosibacterium aquaticum]
MSTTPPPINRHWVLEQIGDDEDLLREIAAVFMLDSPDLRQRLADCLSSGDAAALHATAHCAKSAVGNFGSPLAVAAAVALEEAAQTGDTAALPALTTQLCSALLSVEEALQREVLNS